MSWSDYLFQEMDMDPMDKSLENSTRLLLLKIVSLFTDQKELTDPGQLESMRIFFRHALISWWGETQCILFPILGPDGVSSHKYLLVLLFEHLRAVARFFCDEGALEIMGGLPMSVVHGTGRKCYENINTGSRVME
jgi:hypothetical protein